MLERWLVPGGQNLLHHSYFSLDVSAWFEVTPEFSENVQRNAKQKVTVWWMLLRGAMDSRRLLCAEANEEHVAGENRGQLDSIAGSRCVVEVSVTRIDSVVA